MLHAPPMFFAGGDDIDPRGVDAAVAEDIGQFGDILLHGVKGAGEEMAQIMREDLLRCDARLDAERLHLLPDITAVDRPSARRDEYRPRNDAPSRDIPLQLFLQGGNEKNRSRLPLAGHRRLAPPHRLDRDARQLADTDPRAAHRLQNERQPLILPLGRASDKTSVFLLRQLLLCRAKGLPLHLELPHAQL